MSTHFESEIEHVKRDPHNWLLNHPCEFLPWLEANLDIYLFIKQQLEEVILIGRQHYGIRTITEWVRHDTTMRQRAVTDDDPYKINNDYISCMARLFMGTHRNAPKKFLDVRLTAEQRARYVEVDPLMVEQ